MFRKKQLILILFFLYVSPLFATEILSPLKFRSFSFKTGNDRWSNGISYNMDDQKTYSLGLEADFGTFGINLDAQSFTDKDQNTRYDLLLLDFSLPINLFEHLEITPRLGIGIYGNIGLQGAQNFLHRLMGIYQLDLKYPEHTFFYPRLCADISAYHNFGKFKISFYSSIESLIPFSAEEELGARVDFEGLGIFAGYRFMQKFVNDLTLDAWVAHREGLQIGYRIRKGVLSADYFTNPLTRQGYGEVKISILNPYYDTDINYTFAKVWYVFFQGREKVIVDNFNLIELSYKNIFLQTQFNTGIDGDPMDNGIFSLGYDYSPFYNFSIKPSLKYARFTINGMDDSKRYFGFGVEVLYGITLFEHYKINLLIGANYLIKGEFAPDFGISITLV